ncbi:LysR family transcriptional regulator [Solicola gregarius]|uniref:LysR family transcriptional regulator n=1 Tax=Solicola gregarius TaxID=2908642 RepID=A0AA46YJ76_9ACTN|nr:LysR family transcriptional regulator [Solicola gregarius]UYM04230.1 LysR family transcriptional regulator [Solicola gregarius]
MADRTDDDGGVPNLDVTCLRSLVAVASFAGVRRAADSLHLSQAAVSGHIRRLESQLGFAIVTRQGRNIAFTTRGEDVLREAYRLVAAHDDAVDRLAGADDDAIVIASTEQVSEPMLSAVVDVLSAKHPRTPIGLRFHRSARLREFVHEHRADVAIGFGPLGSTTIDVGDVPLTWFAATDKSPDPNDVVAFSAPCVVRDRMLDASGAQRVVTRECIDLTSLLTAVRDGVGVTALPSTSNHGPGIAPVTHLPTLSPVPLTLATGSRIDARTRREIVAALRTAWVGR